MEEPLDNADEAIELPSAVSDHAIELDSGGGGGIDAARIPAQVASGPNYRDTHLRDALAEGGGSPSQKQRSLSLRIVSELKNLGRLSNQGIMGAGLARDTDSSLKGTCRAILFSVYFEWIILLVIFLNTIAMMVKGPDAPGTPSSFASSFAGHSTLGALDVIDLCVTIVFTLEAIFKIWLQGIGQYLSDNYSRFDLASVILSWVSVILDTTAPSYTSGLNLSAIRSFRAVRPLRAVRFFPNFRFIVEAGYRSVRHTATLLNSRISVVGLQFFMDKMGSLDSTQSQPLSKPSYPSHSTCTPSEPEVPMPLNTIYCSSDSDCLRYSNKLNCTRITAQNREANVDRRFMNFDNIGAAGLVMLRVITWDNWHMLVVELSARQVSFTTLFFVFQILTVCFLSLNMFTAVVVNVFMTYRAEYVGVIFKEVEQVRRFKPGNAEDPGLSARFVQEAISSAIRSVPLSPRQRDVAQKASNAFRIRWAQGQRWYQHQVMEHSFYTGFMVTLLLVNVVSLCMYYDAGFGMPADKKMILDQIQVWCIWIGNVELIIRFMSYKSLHAAHEGIGLVDPLINGLSLLGLYTEDVFPNISIFRLFKFLRSAFVFELLYYFENVRRLYISVSKTIELLLPLLAIMLIFTCVYGLMGMQIFGFTFVQPDGKSPRLNFDNFRNSFFTLFQVITLDDWVSIVCDGLQSITLTSRIMIVPYLVIFVVVECYVLLNLFIAVVVEKFELTNDTKEREQRSRKKKVENHDEGLKRHAQSLIAIIQRLSAIWPRKKINSVLPLNDAAKQDAQDPAVGVLQPQASNMHSSLQIESGVLSAFSFMKLAQRYLQHAGDATTRRALDFCCCVPVRYWLRSASLWLVQHSWFDHLVLVMVVASSIIVAIESPDVTNPEMLSLFSKLNLFFLAFFFLEVLLKSFALGWLMYLSDWWNLFDLIVVVLMLADLTVAQDLGYVRVFRTTRVLRALKIMNHVEEIRTFIAALLDSWPELVSIGVGFTVFVFLWGVIGISLFAGKTKLCSGAVSLGYERCVGVSLHPKVSYLVPNAWVLGGGVDNMYQWTGSFDDIQSSVMALFEVSTLNNWGVIRTACVDASEQLSPPVYESYPWNSVYFIAFVFIAVFYLLNIVISTLVNTYRKKTGSAYRTDEQRLWNDMMRLAVALKPKMMPRVPKQRLCRFAFEIVQSSAFEKVSFVCIVLNAVVLALEFSSQPDVYTNVVRYLHVTVVILFGVECLIRFIAQPSWRFFKDKWNLFDLGVVVLSAIFGLLDMLSGANSLGIVQTLRVVRIIRVVRVIRVDKTLQMTIMTLSLTYIYLATAIMILMICVFIFAVLSFSLFGKVKYGRVMNPETMNFNNFAESVFSLMVMSTSYEHNIVQELSVQFPHCTPDEQARALGLGKVGDCGDPVAASLIFPTFYFLSAHFALSILSAVIVENFNICSVQHCVVFSRIGWGDFETFRTAWMLFDPYCKGRVTIDLIDRIVHILGAMGSQLGNVKPSVLSIQCLKLYASRMSTMHVKDSDLTWSTLLSTHKRSVKKLRDSQGTEHVPIENLNAFVKHRGEAHKYVSFKGLLLCLALFNAEEACLTYSESLAKHRVIQFVRRKASVQLLEEWALKNLKRKALKRKYGERIFDILHLHRFAKVPHAVAKAVSLRFESGGGGGGGGGER